MPPVWYQGTPLGYPDLVAIAVEFALGALGAYAICELQRSFPYRFLLRFLFASTLVFLLLTAAWEIGGQALHGTTVSYDPDNGGWASYTIQRFTIGILTYAWFHPAGAMGLALGLWRGWPRPGTGSTP